MAGLNIPRREQLENGPKLSDLNKARLKAQDRLSDYAERAAVKGADAAFGEDTGDSLLEDLAYGAVPGGSLFQRAKTRTRRNKDYSVSFDNFVKYLESLDDIEQL